MKTSLRRALSLVASILLALGGIAPAGAEATEPDPRSDAAPDTASVVPGSHRPVLEPALRSDPRPAQMSHPALRLAAPAQTRDPGLPPDLRRDPIDLCLIQTFILLHYLDYRESLSVP